MKLAIMQPYIFPYIGYFQLVNSVDKFIFYDDVNYIKGGWINRNRILINGRDSLFTIPLLEASSYKLIYKTELHPTLYPIWRNKFLKTIKQNYAKAQYLPETYNLIKEIIESNCTSISDLIIVSVEKIANHIGISTVLEKSSDQYAGTKGMDKANRLIEICNLNNAKTYINPSGGKELYDKKNFKEHGIDLYFIENMILPYQQFATNFVGGLSIIDVMMFNSKEEIKKMLNQYTLS